MILKHSCMLTMECWLKSNRKSQESCCFLPRDTQVGIIKPCNVVAAASQGTPRMLQGPAGVAKWVAMLLLW